MATFAPGGGFKDEVSAENRNELESIRVAATNKARGSVYIGLDPNMAE
jgi:hypothetical protein